MPVSLSIEANDRFWAVQLPRAAALVRAAVLATLKAEKADRTLVSVNVLLSSDARVRVLNRDWRGKDKPTNVLSFPMADEGPLPPGVPLPLGDIILARQTLVREAEAEGKTLAQHCQHLVVHGVLHLLGYDHMNDRDADAMERREIAVLRQLGVPDPYRVPALSTKRRQTLKV